MDESIDEVLDLFAELITIHGVFHAKLHFSGSRHFAGAAACLLGHPQIRET